MDKMTVVRKIAGGHVNTAYIKNMVESFLKCLLNLLILFINHYNYYYYHYCYYIHHCLYPTTVPTLLPVIPRYKIIAPL